MGSQTSWRWQRTRRGNPVGVLRVRRRVRCRSPCETRRDPRRNPVGRLGSRLGFRLVDCRAIPPNQDAGPRGLRPSFCESHRPRPDDSLASERSAEGQAREGATPSKSRTGAPAALPGSRRIGGRSLPRRVGEHVVDTVDVGRVDRVRDDGGSATVVDGPRQVKRRVDGGASPDLQPPPSATDSRAAQWFADKRRCPREPAQEPSPRGLPSGPALEPHVWILWGA